MRQWKAFDRITLPERGILPEQKATVTEVDMERGVLMVEIDQDDREEDDTDGITEVSLDENGEPDFSEADEKLEKSPRLCLCPGCQIRLQFGASVTDGILSATSEPWGGYGDRETFARTVRLTADALLLEFMTNGFNTPDGRGFH